MGYSYKLSEIKKFVLNKVNKNSPGQKKRKEKKSVIYLVLLELKGHEGIGKTKLVYLYLNLGGFGFP